MFNPIYNFSDLVRHTHLVGWLYREYTVRYDDEDLFESHTSFKDNTALVYSGNKTETHTIHLLDAEEYNTFPTIRLNVVEPDFMIFRNNKFLLNEKGSRVLGRPDLIVEIWSESNTPVERSYKHIVYTSSPTTEIWYMEQDSNKVIRFFGEKQIEDLDLTRPLKTQSGIILDLTRLAL